MEPIDSPTARPPHRMRRRAVQVAVGLAFIAVLWSAAAWYAPPLIHHEIEAVGSDKLGRAVTVGAIAFNPWTLEATLDDVRIAGAGSAASTPQLHVKRLHVDAAWQSLFRLAPVIDALAIDVPVVRLARGADGRLDIDDVLQRFAASPSSEPARFALHNITVKGGSADFTDAAVPATHRVRGLDLAVPFISSLPSERRIKVEPHLAFTLDGSRFDSAAAATPYDASIPGEAHIALQGFDVAPWLGYLPKGMPVQLRSAQLGADLRFAFEQQPRLSLRISGSVTASGITAVDAASQALLDVGSVVVGIDELRPLEQTVRLRRIEVAAPHVLAARNAAGRINLLLAGQTASGTPEAVARVPLPQNAASAAQTLSAASAAAAAPPARGWKVTLAALAVRAGKLDWRDAMTTPPAALALDDVAFDAEAVQWPLDAPVTFRGTGFLGDGHARGRVAVAGSGNAAGSKATITVESLPVALAGPYLRSVLVPTLVGNLTVDATVAWKPAPASAPHVELDARRIVVDALRVGDARLPDVGADRIELADMRADTTARTATFGRITLAGLRGRVERGADGRWSFERWRAAAVPTPGASMPAARQASTGSGNAKPWRMTVGTIAIDKAALHLADNLQRTPVALDVSGLALQLQGFGLDTATPAPFHVAARIAVPAGAGGAAVGSGFAGSIDARGTLAGFVGGVPASAQAAVLLKDLPLHLLMPYVGDTLNLDVQKAQTSFKGDVAYTQAAAGALLKVSGDATIDDFRANSASADGGSRRRALAMVPDSASGGRQLLNWKSLSLRGIDVAVAPGQAPQISVAQTSLSDFFARIVLSEAGRINLQDLTRSTPAASDAAASGAAAGGPPREAAAASQTVAVATAVAPKPPIVRFGPIALVNGRVNYTDLFVKPNYSANLSELAGSLAAFSSVGTAPGEAPQLADLTLRGRVEGTATLEIDGKINPLAKPLALDLKAKVRDLELPPLSTYSVKYAGYGIERGKMSVDLAYLVRPDGQLTASNKIVLNQLAFGDKVEGAPASLPVKLAVALLSDRHGVIDVDLPIGGSINDPQFSLGGLIWKAITTLVVKAVTAPFSLLASAFGGGSSEASTIDFVPGTSTLTAAAKAALDKIATALAERPQLTMTVSGESRLDVEREAWKRDRLEQIVRAEKRRASLGGSANAEVTVSAEEYPALLKAVYKRADIAKPKNVVGLAKELPTNEMEALLLASITVPDDAMQQLAVRRGVAVRDYLAARQLPTNRLFLGAPKAASTDAAWTPRADLKLATQ